MVRRGKTIDIGNLRINIDRSNTIAVYRTRSASVNPCHAVRSAEWTVLRNGKVSRDPPSFFLSLSSRGAPTISTLMPVSLRLDSTLRSVPLPRPPNTVPLPCLAIGFAFIRLSLSYPFLTLAIPLTRFSAPPACFLPVTQFSRSPTADFPPLRPFIPYFSVSRLKTTVHTLPVAFCPTQCVASIVSTTNVYRYRLRLLFLFFPPSLSLSFSLGTLTRSLGLRTISTEILLHFQRKQQLPFPVTVRLFPLDIFLSFFVISVSFGVSESLSFLLLRSIDSCNRTRSLDDGDTGRDGREVGRLKKASD